MIKGWRIRGFGLISWIKYFAISQHITRYGTRYHTTVNQNPKPLRLSSVAEEKRSVSHFTHIVSGKNDQGMAHSGFWPYFLDQIFCHIATYYKIWNSVPYDS